MLLWTLSWIPLPIGISFFVFHNISLLIDYTKNRAQLPTPRLNSTFLYIIFFPQLVSGPIARALQFLPQVGPKRLADVQFITAARWLIAGYFFKLFAANNLSQLTLFMLPANNTTLGSIDRGVLVILYSFQIYSDFFGYSAIAVGLAILFGYRLPINFNLPYRSASFSEFWTRWHISLSTWLRTYLYIPLGGNRQGEARTYVNLMIVMALGGLWHGAGLSYLLWGTLHGLFLIVERPFLKREEVFYASGSAGGSLAQAFRVIFTFALVSLAWTFFRLPQFSDAITFLAGFFTKPFGLTRTKEFYLAAVIYSFPAVAQHLASKLRTTRLYRVCEPFIYGAMLYLALTDAGPDAPFIYFQF